METLELIKRYSKMVEKPMKEILGSFLEKKFQKLAFYQISTGGKRLRPALAIISCQLLGGKIKDVLYPAAGIEILHNYTLIVDDIIDHSHLRRNQPTLWFKFGTSVAECLGMIYAASIFQAAQRSKFPSKINEIFALTLKKITQGEILDVLFERAGRENEPYIFENRYFEISEKDYLKMVSQKTAALFEAACQVGGICANGKKKEIQALKNYGFNLGIAFQIRDDFLDIFGEEKKFGKKIGKDIEERKGGNLLILLALKELSFSKRKTLEAILKKKKIKNEDLKKAIQLIEETSALKKAASLSKKFIKKAKKSLELLPQNKWNEILKEIADFIIQREK